MTKEYVRITKKQLQSLVDNIEDFYLELLCDDDKPLKRLLAKAGVHGVLESTQVLKNYADRRNEKALAKQMFDKQFGETVLVGMRYLNVGESPTFYREMKICGRSLDRTKIRLFDKVTGTKFDVKTIGTDSVEITDYSLDCFIERNYKISQMVYSEEVKGYMVHWKHLALPTCTVQEMVSLAMDLSQKPLI